MYTHPSRGRVAGTDASLSGRFPKSHRVFLARDPGTLKSDIVSKKTSTNNLCGFETLKLKIRRLKLWKPTVAVDRCGCKRVPSENNKQTTPYSIV